MESQWNEQQLFAQEFFRVTQQCRNSQMMKNLESWRNALEGKMSLVMGFCEQKEKESMIKIRQALNLINNNRLTNKGSGKAYYEGLFAEALFLAEADIDTIANIHMPFLNIKKEIDIMDL